MNLRKKLVTLLFVLSLNFTKFNKTTHSPLLTGAAFTWLGNARGRCKNDFIAPARSAGASYSRPGFLNDLVFVIPQWRGILRRRRKIHEYNTRYFKFLEISRNHRLYMRPDFSRNSSNHIAPGPMLTGIELFQHRFSGNPENHSKILT